MLLSTISKGLLSNLNSGRITMTEFLRDITCWALEDGFDEIKPHDYPSPPNNQNFQDYDRLPPDRKLQVDSSFFVKNLDINNYYDRIHIIQNQNKANLEWLEEILTYLPKEDAIARKKIEDKIIDFKDFFAENPIVTSIKDTFNGTEVREGTYEPKSVKEVMNV